MVMCKTTTLDQVMKEWAEASKPTIKPVITHGTGPNWILTLMEIFPTNDRYVGSSSLDDRVLWSAEQLERWPDCSRMAWNMWKFKKKNEAAKFVTLFHLKWDQ